MTLDEYLFAHQSEFENDLCELLRIPSVSADSRHRDDIRCAADYQGRLSGPLLDRIDLHIEVPAVTAADLILPAPTEIATWRETRVYSVAFAWLALGA